MSAIQQLLTDRIDIWTAAETEKKSGRGRTSGNATSVYGIKKLRELILELAMRGKLVPQDASDEPASKLLKLMHIEKAKLITLGKIKKCKPLTVISDNEIPYALPDSWEWLRLPDSYYPIPVSGNQLLSSNIKAVGAFPVIDQGQRFIAGYTDDENLLIRIPGPVIVFGDHTTARKLIDFDFVAGADGVKILRPIAINERFFWLQLVNLKLEGRGYARHYKVLNDCLFALPPISEQARIVEKIDELMALCDQLEAQHTDAANAHKQLVSHLLDTLVRSRSAADFNINWRRIAAHFDTVFSTESSIEALKQTLLQLGVMGHLVEQDANEEAAATLLEKLAQDAQKYASTTKISPPKPEPIPIAPTFKNLPQGWEWVRLCSLFNVITDGDHQSPPQVDKGVPFLTIGNVSAGHLDFSECRFVTEEYIGSIAAHRMPEYGDILYTVVGATYGRAILVNSHKIFCVQRHIAILKFGENVDRNYLLYLLNSPLVYEQATQSTTGTAQPTIPLRPLRNFLVPLPPLTEQTRIVGKIDEIIGLCDKLKLKMLDVNCIRQTIAEMIVNRAAT